MHRVVRVLAWPLALLGWVVILAQIAWESLTHKRQGIPKADDTR